MAPKHNRGPSRKLFASQLDPVKKWGQNYRKAKRDCFDFAALPFELRCQILEDALLVDGPINPYPVAFSNAPKVPPGQTLPNVALLRVSKFVHQEAAAVLYGSNTFILNQDDSVNLPIQPLWASMLALPRPGLNLGTLIIPFDTTGLSTPGDNYWNDVVETWKWKINFLDRAVQEWPIRQKLVLDFTHCVCANGCRLVDCVVGIPRWYGSWINTGEKGGICRLEGSNVVNDQLVENRLGFGTFMEAVKPVFKGLANEAE
ncbi:MAG: hypothetical protein Q9183_007902, partial [Haloplaca sp. 2 TL-2023]